jgi:hypothetical protein
MRTLFRWWALLVVVAVVVQIGLAGVGAFRTAKLADKAGLVQKKTVENFWNPHAVLGSLIVIFALVLLVIAAIGWRAQVKQTAALFGLTILQVLLSALASWKGALGFFHPINALAIAGLSGRIAFEVWTGRARGAEPAPAAEGVAS